MFKLVRVLLIGGLVGKVLGVARELIFAWLFGTGPVASAFRLAQSAFLIPLHGLVSETINGGFTPKYAAYSVSDRTSAKALFTGLYTLLITVSLFVTIILVIKAEACVTALAPGFDAERREYAVNMLRILAVSLPAYVVSGLFASVDLALGRGNLNASRASLQSIGLIIGTIAASWLGMSGLIAVGFVSAYYVFLAIGARTVHNEGLSLKPALTLTPEIKTTLLDLFKVVRVLIWIPIAFQINAVIERRIASLVSLDAMAAVDYARFITETLTILIAMPFGLAGLASMAKMTDQEFDATKAKVFRSLIYVGIPISAMLFANAKEIISILFQRGAFGASSVVVTSQILGGMATGIWAQLIGYAGAKFLTARGQHRDALIASLGGLFLSITILLSGSQILGTNVLGVAASAQGIVFGLYVMWRLGALRSVGLELFSLFFASTIYVAAIWLSKQSIPSNLAISAFISAVYWPLWLWLIPMHKATVKNILNSARIN